MGPGCQGEGVFMGTMGPVVKGMVSSCRQWVMVVKVVAMNPGCQGDGAVMALTGPGCQGDCYEFWLSR